MDYCAVSEDFWFRSRPESRRNTLCISRDSKRRAEPKGPRTADKPFQDDVQLKRERGESLIHPAVAPVSLMSVSSAQVTCARRLLGGQNLAALCTAAGQNLTAVGSSHSLTETVNLGTVTLAGLIGTLHEIHLLLITSMLDSRMAAATHSNVILQSH